MNAAALLLVLLAAGALFMLRQLGWLSARRPWQVATGWNRIPDSERPHDAAPSGDGEPLIRWLGHAGFILRWDDTVLLLDPNCSARCAMVRRVMELPAALSGLPRVDAALISHGHFDHLDAPTLARLPGLRAIALPAGSEVFLARTAIPRPATIPLAAGEIHRIGALEVCAVPAAHNGNRCHPWSSRFHARGYIIRNSAGRCLYFSGDTAFANDWHAIRAAWRPELAILPIGAYVPRIVLKRYHLNPEEAVAAAQALGVCRAIPCHMGTFRVAFDLPRSALPRFARAAAAAGLPWTMPVLLRDSELALFAAAREQAGT